jgi:dipeptidyl aminopeptidase/acylaminoacyl peptidase
MQLRDRNVMSEVHLSVQTHGVPRTDEGSASNVLSADDYARAERFLPWNATSYVINGNPQHHWIANQDRFWYRRSGAGGKRQFVVVDAATGVGKPAFDHHGVAQALSSLTGRKINADELPISAFKYVDDNTAIEFSAAILEAAAAETANSDAGRVRKKWFRCSLDGFACVEIPAKAGANEALSPDGRWAAYVQDFNVWVRSIAGDPAFALTEDGTDDRGYASSPGYSTHWVSDRRRPKPSPPLVVWSPDSRYILTHRLDERRVKGLYLLQSVAEDAVARPILHHYRCAMPGDDQVPWQDLIVFDVSTQRRVHVAGPRLHCRPQTMIDMRYVWWSGDSRTVYFLHRDRFSKAVSLNSADPHTGVVRENIRETSPTIVEVAAGAVYEFPAVRTLSNGDIVWYSARTGWGHIYYYDHLGALRHPITTGEWLVRSIVRVDEASNTIYFMASGREQGRDPYEQRMYRIQFDGSKLQLLTPEEAEHEPNCPSLLQSLLTGETSSVEQEIAERGTFSPSGRFFIDKYSRPDVPPVTVLRDSDGRLVTRLEEADISGLTVQGYTPIEPFMVLAADGKTPIYGNLFRPGNFDPNKKYPVIDANYPGPQMIRTQKSFIAALFDREEAQCMAELGFIVITIDGRGTPKRSKAFLDYSYGRIDRASDVEDHICGIRQLAQRYPYLDLDRVGIYGVSGGGTRAAHAILRYPDFFKVAVSAEGNHDSRLYVSVWGETYIGPLEEKLYEAASTTSLAGNLKGKLFLMHGDMDDNVHPAMTMRLVDALIKANIDFDLLIMPNENHLTAYRTPYFIRRKWDYFVRHLLHAEPPSQYAIQSFSQMNSSD